MICLITDGLAWKRMAVFEDTLIESNIFAFAGIPRTSSIASVVQSWSNKEVLHWLEGLSIYFFLICIFINDFGGF